MKRPLAPIAMCYTGGLLLGDNFHPTLIWLCVGCLVLAGMAAGVPKYRRILILALFVVLGWINLLWRTDVVSATDLRRVFGSESEIVSVRGRIAWGPEERYRTYGERETVHTLAWLDAAEVLRKNRDWQPATGRVLVTTPSVLPEGVRRGSSVELTGVLAPPPGPEEERLFDYSKYLARQSVFFELRTSGTNDWRLLRAAAASVSERFIGWANGTLSRGLDPGDESLQLLCSMTLGERSRLENEDYEPFVRTGTMHIFAISGLHIALISAMLVWGLRLAGIRRWWCWWIALPLIWFYTGATGWQPSAIRSAAMTSIVIAGWALPRPSNLVNSLCAAALGILACDPQQLFGASFQLSFFVVLSIALLMPPVQRVTDGWLGHDPFLAPELIPRWQRWLTPAARRVFGGLGVSFAAWIGALPLTIYYFHLLSPVTLLANLLVVPLSSIALGCNMASLATGAWLPKVPEFLNLIAWLAMEGIVRLSKWWASGWWAVVNVRSLTVFEVGIYYAGVLGVFSGWALRRPRCWWALGAAPLACAGCLAASHFSTPRACLTVLPVDGGLAVHSVCAGEDVLVDCGKSNSVKRLVEPYLRARGVNRLEALVLSHGDLKDVGGAELIAGSFRPRVVCASPVRFRSPVYKGCVGRFEGRGLLRRVSLGAQCGAWHVVHPTADARVAQADEGVLVLQGRLGRTRVLLLGDLNRAGQEALINGGTDLRAEVVVTGLPDHGEPLCDALLERIRPRLIVVGDSERPAFDRARPELMERLRAWGAEVIQTSVSGVTRVEFDGEGGWRVRSRD